MLRDILNLPVRLNLFLILISVISGMIGISMFFEFGFIYQGDPLVPISPTQSFQVDILIVLGGLGISIAIYVITAVSTIILRKQ